MALRKIGKILLLGCAGLLGVLVFTLLAAKLALDRAPQYQAQIKEWVHQRIGYHIAFAHVSPALRWYGPELYFERLELRSKDDARVLARAAGGRVGLDVWQLIHSGKLFAGRVEIDSPTLVVARLAPDQFAVASEIRIGGDAEPLPAFKLDDLPAGTLAIRQGSVVVEHWNAALPRLELRDVNLTLRRGDGAAALAVTALLPPALGGMLSLKLDAKGAGNFDTLNWSAFAHTRGLNLDGWSLLLPEYLSRVGAGGGGFDLTARGEGASLARADLDFNAAHVMTRLNDEPSVSFDQVAGSFRLTHAVDRWTLEGRRVRTTRGGRRDPDADFDVMWREQPAGLVELRATASYLRVETLLPLAGLLPQKDLRQRMQALAPTGEWMDARVALERAAASDPWRLEVQARFRGIGFAPVGRAPGLRGLTGTLAGNESGGRIDIDTQTGMMTWPGEFPQPVDLQVFKTTLYWKRTPDEFLVATPSLDLKSRDARLHAQLAWHQPADGSSPLLTLVSSVDDGNVPNTRLYLPRLLLAPSAVAWLDHAFVAGHLSHADVVLNGPIRQYPFRDGSGLFLARAHLEGLLLNIKDGWPLLEGLAGVAEFRNQGLDVQLTSGHIGNLKLDRGDARFADFKTGELQVHTTMSGDAADALQFLRATPLDESADHMFSSVQGTGPLAADVDLFFPFKEFEHRRTLVQAHLQGVSLNPVGSVLAATELTGDADVDGAQVSRADVHGKLLGGTFQMQARAPRNRPITRTFLVFNGTFSGDALHAALSLPASIPVGGTTDWHGVFKTSPEPNRERSLRVSGSLAGLELNLPDPLSKPVGRALPTMVEVLWPGAGPPAVRLALGSVLRGQFTVDSDANGPKLGRASVSFGAPSSAEPLPFSDSQVVNTGGTIDRLDLAGWLRLYTPDKSAKPVANFLRSATFDVAQIDYLGFSFLDVAVELAATDAGWRIAVGGPNVVGSIALPNVADAAPLKFEFQRLKFVDESPAGTAAAFNAADSSSAANPRGIPAIDFHAAEMIWDDRDFGDVSATLVKYDDGIGLQRLTVNAPEFAVNAKGEWRGLGAGAAHLEGTVASTDVGATLKRLGYDAVMEAKTGKLDFDINWLGAPSAAALSVATGHVQVALDKGQLTGIKPGAGRVIGLASLAALPRRLSLDFSDLTDKGLAFDTIRGSFELHDGSAFTDDVVVKGPAVDIGLIGRVGLKNKDYDQTAVVTGNVSSTLPLAAFAAGPVIGGAVLVFSQVFKQPLRGLTRGYYRITGSWDNPTVERIKSADAGATTAEGSKAVEGSKPDSQKAEPQKPDPVNGQPSQ
jgi:uncharacterized protein (TIGR02099 family)